MGSFCLFLGAADLIPSQQKTPFFWGPGYQTGSNKTTRKKNGNSLMWELLQ